MSNNEKAVQEHPIIRWANTRPNWEKFIWKNCLEHGKLSETQYSEAFKLFLNEYGLDEHTTNEINLTGLLPMDSTSLPEIKLKRIENSSNINAISEGQTITFGENLTIIYGANGSGKSGFGRLMSNACYSRGYSRNILPNLKSGESIGDPKADFVITAGNQEVVLNYEKNSDPITELKRFSVFDSDSVNIHLNNSNSTQFTPGQIAIFDIVNFYIQKIEDDFDGEKRSRLKSNPVVNTFSEETSIVSDFLINLNHQRTEEEIEQIVEFTDSHASQILQLEKLKQEKIKLDIAAKKVQLTDDQVQLASLKTAIETYVSNFSQAKVNGINFLIKKVLEKEDLVKRLGADKFDDGMFKTVGSEKWKALIQAAKELYDSELELNSDKLISNCLLCKQELGEVQQTLFEAYWSFLRNTAEGELKSAKLDLSKKLKEIQDLKITAPSMDENLPSIKLLTALQPDFLNQVKESLKSLKNAASLWGTNIESKSEISRSEIKDVDTSIIVTEIEKKKKEVEELKDPKDGIDKLNKQITELQHRKKANPLKTQLIEYLKYLKWLNLANQARFPKRAYTDERKSAFNQIVTFEYRRVFNEISHDLDSEFGLEVESKGAAGDTVLNLKLNFAGSHNPTEILSEGEQKVAAISDFLTEARLNENNCGIVFDDPVTSLDHHRKERIAKLLVNEAKDRQVIVFTHDIVFFLSLQYYCGLINLPYVYTSVRRSGDSVGIINPDLPWVAQNVRSRIGYLKNKLVEIEKLERIGAEEDEMIEKAKIWYELLREAWERAVEERLFKGVIERYGHGIQTQKLKSIEITSELIKELENGMTESSKWVHDRASGANVHVPKHSEMVTHLDLIEQFSVKCKPA